MGSWDTPRLNIAMFSDSALPVLNGVSISVDLLSKELRERDHEVHLFAPSVKNHEDEDPHISRFLSVQWPITENYPVALPPYLFQYPKFHQIDPDIVHTHTPWMCGLIGAQWARLRSMPLVSTYHTHYDQYAHYVPAVPEHVTQKAIWNHTKTYYNKVDHVITPSEASMKWLLRHEVERPITVVPTGLPMMPPLGREALRAGHELAPDERVLLYVGRLAKEKNLELLFRAVVPVLRAHPDTSFWLVGDGPVRGELEALADQLQVADRVRFVGPVPPQQVSSFYAVAEAFVFASVTETQGLVVMEAMAAGCPPVLVGAGGVKALVEDGVNGLMVTESAEELTAAIERFLGDPSLAARLRTGAEETARRNGVGRMADRVLEVYREVIEDRIAQAVI